MEIIFVFFIFPNFAASIKLTLTFFFKFPPPTEKKNKQSLEFKLETFRSFMKKMGYNWNEKECTRFLEQGGAKPKAKFKGIQSRHWIVALPKQMEHKNKDVKFTKPKAAWEDN